MFDTNVTIIGNVLTAPEWRRTEKTGSLVTKFKIASTARRLDRDSGRWIDGNSLRVRVNCWRKLAEGVASSVMVGDPIIVVGRLYTRDWTDAEGNNRTLYEVEAVAVGHDLSRGRGRFARNKAAVSTSEVADEAAEQHVHGETTAPVPDEEAPALPDDRDVDDPEEDMSEPLPVSPGPGYDPLATLRGGGFEPTPLATGQSDRGGRAGGADAADMGTATIDGAAADGTATDGTATDGAATNTATAADGERGTRGRRGRARAPQPV